MPTAHTPNADEATYKAHFLSAFREWVRTGVISLENLAEQLYDTIAHPSAEDLKAAANDSQDGTVAYHFNPGDGTVSVAPAIPHTEETRAAAEAAAKASSPGSTTAEAVTAAGDKVADAIDGQPDETDLGTGDPGQEDHTV